MKRISLLFLLLCSTHVFATTWYVRTDGGTATQCTGTTNAPYPGSGTGVACAVNHPYWLLNQSTFAWIPVSGDTVQFEDVGPYYMGQLHNGIGTSWPFCGDVTACHPPSFPDGLHFLGKNAGSCHNSDHTSLVNPTQFVAINSLYQMFRFVGTNNVDFECVDITQLSNCTSGGGATALNVIQTSLTSNVATYTWRYPASGNFPTSNEPVTVSGSTNGSGAFNVFNITLSNLTHSTYAITSTQATSATTAIYGWSLTSGVVPVVGEHDFQTSGTTNGGGQFNFYNNINNGTGSITAVTVDAGGTTGTFTFTATNPSRFTVVGQQVESGTDVSQDSGTFTLPITHADISSATDTGTINFAGYCGTPGQSTDSINGAIVFEQSAGDQGPSNLTMKDVAVHGGRASGIVGSKINTLTTDVTNMSDIYLFGNGSAGWNTDSMNGGCHNNCESIGTINASYFNVQWNGCKEVEPNGGTYGGNGFNYCVDQAFGGYGDGLTMLANGGTWNWSDTTINYNTQDGFDLLHIGDDSVTRPTVNAVRIYAEGNEGQSIKGGGGQMTLTDSIGIANCGVFATGSNFPGNPNGWNSMLGLMCRAADAMAFGMQDGDTLTIENVTNIAGDQNTAWDMATTGCTTNCVVIFKNNATMAFSSPFYGGQYAQAFAYGAGGSPFTNPSSVRTNNGWWQMGGGSCAGTNPICTDPKFVAESDLNAMNVQLTSGSPLIGKGVAISGLTTDFAGNPWLNPPSIGAYEYGVAPPTGFTTTISGGVIFSGSVRF